MDPTYLVPIKLLIWFRVHLFGSIFAYLVPFLLIWFQFLLIWFQNVLIWFQVHLFGFHLVPFFAYLVPFLLIWFIVAYLVPNLLIWFLNFAYLVPEFCLFGSKIAYLVPKLLIWFRICLLGFIDENKLYTSILMKKSCEYLKTIFDFIDV